MITADQIVAHLVGDYVLQSDWMAKEKVGASVPAAIHALCYSLPFLILRPSVAAFVVIASTHFVIDRWRLARFVVWAKNWIAPWSQRPYSDDLAGNGYAASRPIWLTTWLFIIADNTMHLLCNGAALRWL